MAIPAGVMPNRVIATYMMVSVVIDYAATPSFREKPIKPTSPEPISQIAAGTGT